MPLPMAPQKLARAALSKRAHGRSRLSRRVSPADELAHGLRPSPLPPGSTESRLVQHSMSSPTVAAANLDKLAKGRIRYIPGRGHLRARFLLLIFILNVTLGMEYRITFHSDRHTFSFRFNLRFYKDIEGACPHYSHKKQTQ